MFDTVRKQHLEALLAKGYAGSAWWRHQLGSRKLNEQERKAALEALNSVSAREAGVPIMCSGPRRQIRVGNRAERRSPRVPHSAEGT